ncbi:hypothetical protein PsorP6_003675 [Peronosclerospora sorghi]|uniref:Uncharacterized protein n=1 Tax=Peronosclerospora sorghi TaxID=230839 RepID=A0ACC0VMH7_9STRA|nr:hypothetical protein PsorP6_003675 [Peronosclerospora sorghi]
MLLSSTRLSTLEPRPNRQPETKGSTHAWNENNTENGSMNCSVDAKKKPIMANIFKPVHNETNKVSRRSIIENKMCKRTSDPSLKRREST